MLIVKFFILLHQRQIYFGVLCNFYSELWVIKPSIITLNLKMFRCFLKGLFCLAKVLIMLGFNSSFIGKCSTLVVCIV
jgi:hypothetical protein